MTTLVTFLNLLLPFLYAATVWAYGKAFFSDVPWAQRWKSGLLYLTAGLHVVYLVVRQITFSHPPITTVFEIFSILSLSVTLVYVVVEVRSHQRETGYFILIISFFFQLVSSFFVKDLENIPDVLRSNLLGFHVTSALLGYSAITVSAAYAFLYLMLYHEIKKTRFGVIYRKLPNLAALERMSTIAILLAFLLLGLAIIVGFIWLPRAIQSFSYSDPKLIVTLLLLFLYGAAIGLNKLGDWRGRRLMILSIVGFVISIFSLTIINVFFSGFHRFY